MKKLTKALATLLAVCLMALGCGMAALAAETNLPDSFLIDDENGISVGETGEYFLYSDKLMPGDIITRTLTLRNLEQGEPFRLYLLGDAPTSEGNVDWLDNLHLQITLDERELYAGRLRGDGADTRTMKGNGIDLINQGLELGEFKEGDYGVLQFIVTVDAAHLSTEDLAESSTANIGWVFNAVKDAEPEPPDTGDAVRNGMYILLLLVGVLCIVGYIKYKRLRRA